MRLLLIITILLSSLRGQEFTVPTYFSIVFDTSGSMNDNQKLVNAKAAFGSWLLNQTDKDQWSLFVFTNGRPEKALPFTQGTKAIRKKVSELVASGGTPIVNSLLEANEQIRGVRRLSPASRHVIVVFTDGEENVHASGTAGVQKLIITLRGQNTEVVCIGFGGQGGYLAKAATKYFSANGQSDLRAVLEKVSAEIDPNEEVRLTAEELKRLR